MIYFFVLFGIFIFVWSQVGFFGAVFIYAGLALALISVMSTLLFIHDVFTGHHNLGGYALAASPLWILIGAVYLSDKRTSIKNFFKQALSAPILGKVIFLAWIVMFLSYTAAFNYLDWNSRVLNSALRATEHTSCRTGYGALTAPVYMLFDQQTALRDSPECRSAEVLAKIQKEKADYPYKPLYNGDYVLFAFGLFIGLYTLAFFGRRRMNKRTKLPA